MSEVEVDIFQPMQVFVITDEQADPNVAIHSELAVVNWLMSTYPGNVFLSRSTFVMTELFQPRSMREWADTYRSMVQLSDAVFAHGDEEVTGTHPLVHYAYEMGVPVVSDPWDLGLLFETVDISLEDE